MESNVKIAWRPCFSAFLSRRPHRAGRGRFGGELVYRLASEFSFWPERIEFK